MYHVYLSYKYSIVSLFTLVKGAAAFFTGFFPRQSVVYWAQNAGKGAGRAMEITEVRGNKKQYLALLLLADEQEDMIDRYLESGTMYVLRDGGGVKSECVVADAGGGVLEIKNLATAPEHQGRGYAKALVEFLAKTYAGRYGVLQAGTGDSPLTVPFYEKCGFARSHRIPRFFTDNYDHPIYEGGVQLVDMVYLQREI